MNSQKRVLIKKLNSHTSREFAIEESIVNNEYAEIPDPLMHDFEHIDDYEQSHISKNGDLPQEMTLQHVFFSTEVVRLCSVDATEYSSNTSPHHKSVQNQRKRTSSRWQQLIT